MRLTWHIKGGKLVIQLVRDDDQGTVIESEIAIPLEVLRDAKQVGRHEPPPSNNH